MPAGRFISKSIAVNKQLRRVSLEADFLFTRCIPHLDRDGRLEGEPEIVKAIVCPLRPEMTAAVIERALQELNDAELVVWYEVQGEKCLLFPGFPVHQSGMKYDREAPSRIPSPPRKPKKSGDGPAKVRTNSGPCACEVLPREVMLSEVKNPTSGEVDSKSFAFMGFLRPVWREVYGGDLPPGSAKRLKPTVGEHGVSEVARRLRIYCESTPAAFASVPKFVSTFGKWNKQALQNGERMMGVGRDPTVEELASIGIHL
jgi:hypothetical protein